jgi:hypothetical protein
VVAGVDVRFQRGIGVGDLADHPDRRLRREPKPLLELGVEALLHIMLAAHLLRVHRRRQPRRRLVATTQRDGQRSSLRLVRQHAHLDHLLHTRTLTDTTDISPVMDDRCR